ncbi:MAG: zf-HC2 domain-containing protein [Woeseiaceae bacterium]
MNCTDCTGLLDQYLDGELAELEAASVKSHSEGCGDCSGLLKRKIALRQGLRAMPFEEPEDGFYDRVLENTLIETQRHASRFWATAGIGTAVAAGIIALAVALLPVDYSHDVDAVELEGVTIALNLEKTVRISFDSINDLDGATLTVQLPPGVEIAGYGDRKEISWSTNVSKGVNILALPIVVTSGAGGTIVAHVEHAGKTKAFKLDVSVS